MGHCVGLTRDLGYVEYSIGYSYLEMSFFNGCFKIMLTVYISLISDMSTFSVKGSVSQIDLLKRISHVCVGWHSMDSISGAARESECNQVLHAVVNAIKPHMTINMGESQNLSTCED